MDKKYWIQITFHVVIWEYLIVQALKLIMSNNAIFIR